MCRCRPSTCSFQNVPLDWNSSADFRRARPLATEPCVCRPWCETLNKSLHLAEQAFPHGRVPKERLGRDRAVCCMVRSGEVHHDGKEAPRGRAPFSPYQCRGQEEKVASSPKPTSGKDGSQKLVPPRQQEQPDPEPARSLPETWVTPLT